MTAILPIACRCGATMRLAELRDGFECRCGMYVDHGAVLAAAGAPLPDAAFQQGEPWKDGEPGIRISDQFANAVAPCWDTAIEVDPAKFSDAATLQRACADAFERSGLRYVGKIEHGGRGDLTIEGETVERHRVYALVPVGQEAEAVRGVVQFILRKHGPGRIWAHGDVPIGPLKRRADAGWRGAEVGGVLHVVMGCYYFHRPEPARVAGGPSSFSLREQDGALYIDTKHGPIKITTDPTMSPREVRVEAPRVSAGVFHIDPDPPDLARRQAARVLERQEEERMRFLATPIGATATRPDGFDQHQVDAARAALLAPASPRYPRSR